jgi:hypothetical protein
MIFIFIKPDQFVAGIIADAMQAGAYLTTMPEGDWTVLRIALAYPFYLIERTVDHKRCYSVEAEGREIATLSGTIYLITDDYEPPKPWTDYMGALSHIHAE